MAKAGRIVSKEGLWVCMLASVILFEVKLLMERLHKSPGNEEQRFQVALPPHQTISSAVVDAGEDMSSDVRSGSASTRGGLQKNGPPAPANVPVNKVPAPSRDLYIIFVTDCSVYQRWFAFSVWNSARIAGQTSPITWIRTGCKPGQRDNDKATAVELYPRADIIDMLPNDGKSGHTFVLEMGQEADASMSEQWNEVVIDNHLLIPKLKSNPTDTIVAFVCIPSANPDACNIANQMRDKFHEDYSVTGSGVPVVAIDTTLDFTTSNGPFVLPQHTQLFV